MAAPRTSELAYWILERERMRLRKENPRGADDPDNRWHYGYSDDPAMGEVRYCNIRREDDKVTRWIAQNWRNPNAKDHNLTLAMVMARMINWPETLSKLGYPHGDDESLPIRLAVQMAEMKKIPGKKWTSAYTISTCGRKMDKVDYVFDHVLAQVADPKWEWGEYFEKDDYVVTLDDAHKRLMRIDGLGSFLAAQVVADLKNTPGNVLQDAPDFWTWSAPGPGSLRGLAAYHGWHVTPSTYQGAIELCYNEVAPLVEPYVGRLHMQDFQNCLCEFSKFIRAKEGDGRVRNKYRPG